MSFILNSIPDAFIKQLSVCDPVSVYFCVALQKGDLQCWQSDTG